MLYGILFALLILILLRIIQAIYRTNIKGAIGEYRVAKQLSRLNPEQFKVLNNILIKTNTGSYQIDHIVVSIFGVFIIETKNYKGWIHGNENSEYWTQTIYNKKSKFRNPVRQNWSHIYALKEILSDYEKAAYHPIVVFAGSAELKNIRSKVPIIYCCDVYLTIMKARGGPNLSADQVNGITDILAKANVEDKEARKEHLNYVRHHIWERKQKEKSHICPRCGRDIVLREGKYGKFYGCSQYPNCRYTRKCGAL